MLRFVAMIIIFYSLFLDSLISFRLPFSPSKQPSVKTNVNICDENFPKTKGAVTSIPQLSLFQQNHILFPPPPFLQLSSRIPQLSGRIYPNLLYFAQGQFTSWHQVLESSEGCSAGWTGLRLLVQRQHQLLPLKTISPSPALFHPPMRQLQQQMKPLTTNWTSQFAPCCRDVQVLPHSSVQLLIRGVEQIGDGRRKTLWAGYIAGCRKRRGKRTGSRKEMRLTMLAHHG